MGLHFISYSIIEGSQGRNLETGADAESMEGAAYWLDPYGLLSLLSYRTWDHQPKEAPPTMSLSLPRQSVIKKIFYRVTYNPIL